MDWSAVYDNHGEEDGHWEDQGETRSSRNAHRLLHRKMSIPFEPKSDDVTTQYSPLVAYAFTVNYILGVGSLGIPYAFYRAGLVMSNLMIVLVTLISYMTVMWVSETVARAREAYVIKYITEETPLSHEGEMKYNDFPEVTQLCDRFLGKIGAFCLMRHKGECMAASP